MRPGAADAGLTPCHFYLRLQGQKLSHRPQAGLTGFQNSPTWSDLWLFILLDLAVVFFVYLLP
uniref:Uncharacterized protein n=1 Tax=Equus asinus TaxID=9793 RepID=A0A8C4MUA7_EQUAS